MRQAIILCGGLGTRLGDNTKNIPKPLLDVGGKPFIDYLIRELSRYSITEILLFAGYLGEQFVSQYHQKKINGTTIQVCLEPRQLGTGGGLMLHKALLDDEIFILNGDTWTGIDFRKAIMSWHSQKDDLDAMLCVGHSENADRYGLVNMNDKFITSFTEKSNNNQAGNISLGATFLKTDFFKKQDDAPLSLEKDYYPTLTSNKRLGYFLSEGSNTFIDMGTIESLNQARQSFTDTIKRPALFLDRDNTINIDNGYTYLPEDLKWVNGALETIKLYNEKGWYVFIITNQAGIAKNHFSEDESKIFNEYLIEKASELNAQIDAYYYCPHHIEGVISEYSIDCNCRKPKTGMLEKCVSDWPIDLENSIMIGDKETDVMAGKKMGIGTNIHFKGENLLHYLPENI